MLNKFYYPPTWKAYICVNNGRSHAQRVLRRLPNHVSRCLPAWKSFRFVNWLGRESTRLTLYCLALFILGRCTARPIVGEHVCAIKRFLSRHLFGVKWFPIEAEKFSAAQSTNCERLSIASIGAVWRVRGARSATHIPRDSSQRALASLPTTNGSMKSRRVWIEMLRQTIMLITPVIAYHDVLILNCDRTESQSSLPHPSGDGIFVSESFFLSTHSSPAGRVKSGLCPLYENGKRPNTSVSRGFFRFLWLVFSRSV